MKSALYRNQDGSGLIGILVVVVVLAALVYGGVFFSGITNQPFDKAQDRRTDNESSNNNKNIIDTFNQAKSDIDKIQGSLDEQGGVANHDDLYINLAGIKAGDLVSSPLEVTGSTDKLISEVVVELRNAEHEALVSEPVAVKEAGPGGEFGITLNFEFSSTKEGFIAVYDKGNKDSLFEIPVKYSNQDN